MQREWITTKEVMELFGVSKWTVNAWVHISSCPCQKKNSRKKNSHWLFHKEKLGKWFLECRAI